MKHFNLFSILLVLLILPFYLQAQSFDIYFVDSRTGKVFQVTDMPEGDEFNVTFSNNGHQIAYDFIKFFPSFSHDVLIRDLDRGENYPLIGADGGNNSSWSPNGRYIAFDRNPYGDPNIYYVPAQGGDRTMIADLGGDPEWSNNSKAIAFNDYYTGGISTVKIDGSERTPVSTFGYGPSWSPNGKYIAFASYYDERTDIFVVKVTEQGYPLEEPVQITFSERYVYNSPPSWSNNGKKLIFHSNRLTDNFDFDIWTYDLQSEKYERLAGFLDSGEYDPCSSKNGQYVGFSHFTEPISPRTNGDLALTLHQNYPNPFNTSTTINLELDKRSMVQLIIYDQLGRMTDILVNNNLEKGNHQIIWNPGESSRVVPGGIYYMRLITPQENITKQMIYTPK